VCIYEIYLTDVVEFCIIKFWAFSMIVSCVVFMTATVLCVLRAKYRAVFFIPFKSQAVCFYKIYFKFSRCSFYILLVLTVYNVLCVKCMLIR